MTMKKTQSKTVKKSKRKINKKMVFMAIVSVVVVLGLIVCTGGAVIAANMISKAPEVKISNFESQESSQILDKEGHVIAEIGSQIRTNITYDDLPTSLVDAFVSVEDSRFFEHNGFDISRFTKAMLENLAATIKARRILFTQGGSTLTMQLIDNSYFMSDDGAQGSNGITQKVQEIYMAMKLEPQTNKKRILEYYLNKVNFGGTGNIRGVQKAAEFYYGKDVSELTLAESALLAGIVNAPSRYNPLNHLDYATTRRNTVLNLMVRHGYITKEEADLAKSINVEDLLIDASSANRGSGQGNPYQSYIDVVIQEVKTLTGKDPTIVPMKIYTCMDASVQSTIDEIQAGTVEGISFPDDAMEMAIVSLNNQNGEIVAIGGGRNYSDGGSLLLNHATDQYNQPGSSVKPFLSYALAFEYLGWSTSHVVMDQPFVYAGTTKVVKNFNGKYNGQMKLVDAVGTSMNTPALQTLQDVIDSQSNGRAKVVEYLQNLGLSKVQSENFDIGYAIGGSSFQVNAVELAGAHATMMNQGNYIQPHTVTRIEFTDGTSPLEPVYSEKTVLSEEAAYLVTELMYQAVNGPYSNYMQILKRKYAVYGKTGTSNWGDEAANYGIPVGNAKDKWMVSSTSQYTTAVWVGYEKADSENYWTSAKSKLNLPGHISSVVLDALNKDITPEPVAQPSGVKSITHILGTYPYASPVEGMDSTFITTGKIKSEFYSLVEPQSSSLEQLIDFKANIDSTGKITMHWTPYPDASKLQIASEDIDLGIEVGGRWIEAYGKRLFDWTWLFGAVRYNADILVNGETVKNVTSETESAEETITLTAGSTIKVCGYYAFENLGSASNQVCSSDIQVADTDIEVTIPSSTATRASIESWVSSVGFTKVNYSEVTDSSKAGLNIIRFNGTEANGQKVTVKSSAISLQVIDITIYTAPLATPTPVPTPTPTPTIPTGCQDAACTAFLPGYTSDGNGGAKISIENCSEVTAEGACRTCTTGYVFNEENACVLDGAH